MTKKAVKETNLRILKTDTFATYLQYEIQIVLGVCWQRVGGVVVNGGKWGVRAKGKELFKGRLKTVIFLNLPYCKPKDFVTK